MICCCVVPQTPGNSIVGHTLQFNQMCHRKCANTRNMRGFTNLDVFVCFFFYCLASIQVSSVAEGYIDARV